jgi:TPR repeat protein
VSALHWQGFALMGQGRLQEALVPLGQAAKLGDVYAMKDAGDACTELGLETEAQSWFDRAASAGNPAAMYNMGAFAIRNGDRVGAMQWFERSAQAGDSKAFAALTQLADDAAAERRWARLGAEAGDSSCMVSHGHHLSVDAADWDTPRLRRALSYVEQAAERHDDTYVEATLMAGDLNRRLGNATRAGMWFDRARETGDPDALDMLRRFGL